MTDDALTEFATLLDEVADALKQGNLADLADLEIRLTALEPALADAEQGKLTELLSKAERNQLLLKAAGRGVRSAQRRLSEIAKALQGLSTYDKTGSMQPRDTGESILRKRF